MREFTLSRVHDYRQVQDSSGSKRLKLVEFNPYVSFKQGDEGPFFVQNGFVFSEGGERISEDRLPGWFWEQARRVREDKRTTTGLDQVLERAQASKQSPAPAQEESEQKAGQQETSEMDENYIFYQGGQKMWWCPECQISMPTKKKGMHIVHYHKKKSAA